MPSQIACMVMTVLKNLCTVLIPLCKNNFNSFFFLSCAWLPPPLVHCVLMLATLLCYTEFFVCFHKN